MILTIGNQSHFDELYDIYMNPSVNPFLDFEVMAKGDFKPLFETMIDEGELLVYLDEDPAEGPIYATCIIQRHNNRMSHCATICTLATHPHYQGQGIGKQFMRAVIKKLKEEGFKRIDLYAEEDNPGALAFYEKLGFEIEGRMKNFMKRANYDHYVDELILALKS